MWVGNSKEIVLDMQSVVTREITVYGTYTCSHQAFGETIGEMADMGIDAEALSLNVSPLKKRPRYLNTWQRATTT